LIGLPLPIGMALMALYAVANLRHEHGRSSWGVGSTFVAVMSIAAVSRDIWLPWLGGDAAIIAALILFCIAIFAGVPVGFVLLLAVESRHEAPLVDLTKGEIVRKGLELLSDTVPDLWRKLQPLARSSGRENNLPHCINIA